MKAEDGHATERQIAIRSGELGCSDFPAILDGDDHSGIVQVRQDRVSSFGRVLRLDGEEDDVPLAPDLLWQGRRNDLTKLSNWALELKSRTPHCSNVSGSCIHANDSGDFYDWNSGEPNNSGYGTGTGEHYLEINYLGDGIWNDIPNSTTIAAFCWAILLLSAGSSAEWMA